MVYSSLGTYVSNTHPRMKSYRSTSSPMCATQGIDTSSVISTMANIEPREVFYPTDSNEWRLLQELSTSLIQRKASYHALPRARIDQISIHHDASLLEIELRRTFIVQQTPQSLPEQEFKHFQTALKNLCSVLDRLALHRNTRGNLKGQDYANLRALIGVLDSTSGEVDLVNGPNESLFKLPNNAADLRNCLCTVTECNNALSGLLTPPPLESSIRPSRVQRGKVAWKKSKVRDQAIRVLEALFEHFQCGMSHEVLLKLLEENENPLLPNLRLMLSSCPELKSWEEVQYGDADLYV